MPRANRTGVRGLYKNDKTGRYHFDLRFNDAKSGKPDRYRESFGPGLSFAAAKERARTLTNALLTGSFEKHRAPSMKLRAAFDEYLAFAATSRPASIDDRRDHANALVDSLGDVELDSLTPYHLERFKTERMQAGRAPATVNRHLATFKHFVGLASDWGWIAGERADALRRVKLMKEPPGRVRYLAPDEKQKLLDAAEPDLRIVILTGLHSGMRREEMVSLRWSQVDLASRLLLLTKTKSNRVRGIPINDTLAAVLAPLQPGRRADHHVLRREGKPWSPNTLSSLFARTVRAAGIRDLRLHDLRHDFATQLISAGTPINVVAELLGHSTLTTTQRYAHVEPRTLRAAVDALVSPRETHQQAPSRRKSSSASTSTR